MKNSYLYLFTIVLFMQTGMQAQNIKRISAMLLNKNYSQFVPNYPIYVIDSATAPVPSVATYTYTTNANGRIVDTLALQGTVGSLWFRAPDSCGFTQIVLGYGANTPFNMAQAGLVMCNKVVVPPPTIQCQAAYIVDTVNSQPGTVYLWNVSTHVPTSPSANAIVSYVWDFGDGTTSNLAFPTHAYSGPGTFPICVAQTVVETTSMGFTTCSSIHCDTVTVDQNGQLIYNGNGIGWNLVVLDPATIGVQETDKSPVSYGPNPTKDVFYLHVPTIDDRGFDITITDYQGRPVWKRADVQDAQMEIDMTSFAPGLYWVRLDTPQDTQTFKIVKN